MTRNPHTPMTKVGERQRPPKRRLSETRRLKWKTKTVHITVGYDDSGQRPLEIFYNGGYRSGSDMEALISDVCIALSVMLQHEEVTAAHLAHSMSRTFSERTGQAEPASILGVLLREIMRPPAWADAVDTGQDTAQEPSANTGASDSMSSGTAATGADETDTADPDGTGGRS